MNFRTKAFLAATVALYTASAVVLSACGGVSNCEDLCDDSGSACGEAQADIDKCKAACTQGETLADKSGCRSQYDDLMDCAIDIYSTPSQEQCDNPSSQGSEDCATQSAAMVSCINSFCTANPTGC